MARVKGSKTTGPRWDLCLYVTDQTIRSRNAFDNAKRMCEEYLAGRYQLEVVDLMADPGRAKRDNIVAVPTLVRKRPLPARTVIGDLSDTRRMLMGLDV